ncbi:hypothetical protein CFC21_056442 [Triticum aestivum]|uniref:mitogen-activated protein kinase kinase n=1 Tax=Triticum aestivum TaxID=4565 RepID=A0A9R1GI49_WHEAT|nr:hypothetical protein CFC21_056442 [Triticum aestivum]
MALIREKRLPQLHLSLPVPPRAAAQELGVLGRRPNPAVAPAPTATKASTPSGLSSQFRLADFEKLAVLGRGNGGTVYKVRHRETCALYALKVQHYGDPAAAAEADVLGRTGLAHSSSGATPCSPPRPPATSRCSSSWWTAGRSTPSGAAAARSRRPRSRRWRRRRCPGLAYLHARRIVHLDVKPANLLASTAGEVKVADFGIARVLARAGDHCTSYAGTSAYMSPERFDPEAHGGHYDPYAADVWSLGVTLLELFMGRYPLLPAGQRPSWAALMCAVCFGEPPVLPAGASSPELRGFVASCLQKDYRNRASVAELLAHPFVAGRDMPVSKCALRKLVADASSSL